MSCVGRFNPFWLAVKAKVEAKLGVVNYNGTCMPCCAKNKIAGRIVPFYAWNA